MALNLKSFAQLVADQAAAIQAQSVALLDFTVGSIMRAFIEANSAIVLWLQGLIAYTLTLTRAATSQGTDLDTWMTDYGVIRLSASFSAGTVTFARFSTTAAALVPIGTTVRSLDGTQNFSVTIDPTNDAFSLPDNAYIIPIGITSVTVPVSANVAGTAGNVAPGTIGLITSSTPGVDTVTNAVALIGGAIAESDAELRARFVSYIASLSKATELAIGYAVTSLQLGAEYTIIENMDTNGNAVYGFFIVTVDDGTGSPSLSFITAVGAAIENTRAAGVRYGVLAPVIVNVYVSFSLFVATGYDANSVAGTAGNAVTSYINSLPLGASLPYSRLPQVIYDSTPGILNVENLLLNSNAVDIAVTKRNVIKALTVSVGISPT